MHHCLYNLAFSIHPDSGEVFQKHLFSAIYMHCASSGAALLLCTHRLQGSTFRLSYLEDALGSQLLMQAAQGNNPYLIAALKSLPITADDVDPAAAAEVDGSDSTSKGRGIGPATQQEKQLARALLQQVDAEVAACGSSLQEDEQLLQQLRQQQQQTMRGGAAEGSVDVRRIAAVRYRIERKRLLQACQVLLNIFLRE